MKKISETVELFQPREADSSQRLSRCQSLLRQTQRQFLDRFMVGTDMFVLERWGITGSHAGALRTWLAELPPDIAERIPYENGEALLTAEFSKRRYGALR